MKVARSVAEILSQHTTLALEYAERNGIDVVSFRRGERKDDRTQEYLRNWSGGEGVLYIGKAQEKARVLRTERRHNPATGATYARLLSSGGDAAAGRRPDGRQDRRAAAQVVGAAAAPVFGQRPEAGHPL